VGECPLLCPAPLSNAAPRIPFLPPNTQPQPEASVRGRGEDTRSAAGCGASRDQRDRCGRPRVRRHSPTLCAGSAVFLPAQIPPAEWLPVPPAPCGWCTGLNRYGCRTPLVINSGTRVHQVLTARRAPPPSDPQGLGFGLPVSSFSRSLASLPSRAHAPKKFLIERPVQTAV
jgi:hypothetical protein